MNTITGLLSGALLISLNTQALSQSAGSAVSLEYGMVGGVVYDTEQHDIVVGDCVVVE